jgi:glycosyltransferase involved in cell wall biosynthesis
VSFLLDIARNLPQQIRDRVHWLIIGDGPIREQLEKEAPANMTFTGYLNGEQLAEVYSASDLFIFPSATETFGNVVLESLASGTPVIGARSGGVKNIITHGVTGILCEANNLQQFTNGIVSMIASDSKRLQMSYEGRNYALSQKWDKIFDDLLVQYSHVIGRNMRDGSAISQNAIL